MVSHRYRTTYSETDSTGFSSGVNPDEFKGQYESGYDPLWEDMVLRHHVEPLHCMVGGGDQIYCDAITREPELQSAFSYPAYCDLSLTYIQAGSMPRTGRASSLIR